MDGDSREEASEGLLKALLAIRRAERDRFRWKDGGLSAAAGGASDVARRLPRPFRQPSVKIKIFTKSSICQSPTRHFPQLRPEPWTSTPLEHYDKLDSEHLGSGALIP